MKLPERSHLLLLAALWLAGCGQTPPTQFYTLTPVANKVTELTDESNVSVGIAQIILPDYLNRPQVVTRIGANQMQLDDFDSWIESLDAIINRTIVRDVGVLLDSDRVVALPEERFVPIDYRVDIVINRFDSGPGDDVTLETRWAVTDDRTGDLISTRLSVITEALADPATTEMRVSSMSKALGRLSREIATAIALADTK